MMASEKMRAGVIVSHGGMALLCVVIMFARAVMALPHMVMACAGVGTMCGQAARAFPDWNRMVEFEFSEERARR